MGRNQTPNSVLLKRGSAKSRANEPEPKDGAVVPTRLLSPLAMKSWDRICSELEHIGVLKPIYADLITIAADALADIEIASNDLTERGQISITERGETKNPSFTIKTTAQGVAFKYLSALGMSPTSIGKIAGVQKEESNPFLEL